MMRVDDDGTLHPVATKGAGWAGEPGMQAHNAAHQQALNQQAMNQQNIIQQGLNNP
ncbi:hypothetical protein NHF46_03000 [Arthrobacter alpinus]|nr:hypothetical protein [Arthrobacter alpinus]